MDKLIDDQFAVLVGLDWADQKHDICWLEPESGKTGRHQLEHTPEAIVTWLNDWRTRYPGRQIALALELTKGALINALLGYDFLVLFPLNPASVKTYRTTFHPSGAKDDPTDAQLILDMLCKHRDQFRPWTPDDPLTRKLAMFCEHRRKTVDECTRLTLQITAHLKGYYPQALDWLDRLNTNLACGFLQKWPTLAAFQKASPKSVRAFYYASNGRSNPNLEVMLEQRAAARELTRDTAIIDALSLMVLTLAGQVRVLLAAIRRYDAEIESLFDAHPDAPIFAALPGAGKNLAPRLLSAFGSNRDRHESAEAVQKYVGIAPVTERSGKSTWIHWRWHCPKYVRQAFHEFAHCSIRYSPWARAYYDGQIQRGKKHHAAIRALAFKWIRIIYRCWKTRALYDENSYLQALAKSGSPLWNKLQSKPAES